MPDLTLTSSRLIPAPPKRVFDAWLDPAILSRFMLPAAGVTVPVARTDPKVGGRFEIVMKTPEREIPHAGTYLVIDRHSRLVFTWESPMSAEGSTVTIDFAPRGKGTLVTLTHVKFPSEESRANHEAGWGAILGALEKEAA